MTVADAPHNYGRVNPSPALSAGQWLALVVGLAFTAIGLAGFFVTGLARFAADRGDSLLGFEVNPLHNLVHLALGIAGLAMWRRPSRAFAYGAILAAVYLPAFLYGIVAIYKEWDVLAVNWPDNLLHLGTGLAGIAIAARVEWDRRRAGPLRY